MLTEPDQLFAVFQGEDFVAVGTAVECAKKCGLKAATIRNYASDPKRCKKYRVYRIGSVIKEKDS